jgi:glycosyltransferase involved in cell wall biosynthesis
VRVLLDVSAVPAQPVGAGAYVINLARALHDNGGIDLHLLARRDDGPRWAALAPAAEVLAEVPASRPARLAWEQVRGPAMAARIRPDVWHGPHYTLPLRLSVPSVVTVHDMTFFDHPEWHERSKTAFFRPMTRVAVNRATEIVAVSDATSRRLTAVLTPHAPVTVIPHGVDHERFHPPAPGDAATDLEFLRAHGVRPPYLVFVGTIEPRKDIPTLVHAFARATAAAPELRLVLAGGDGWGTVAVREAIARSGAATRVLRLGYVPSAVVPALLRHAEIACYPALVEGFGLPALEALACGAALVTTKGTAMEDVAGAAAVLVPPGDRDALADALGSLLTDPAERDRLRQLGPAIAAPYTWAASAAKHVEVYRRAQAR